MYKSSKISNSLLFTLCLLLISCQDTQEPLIVATYTYHTNNRIDNLSPFSEKLSQKLGREVKTKSYPDVATFIAGINAGEVDLAFINTFGYLLLALDNQLTTPVAALKVEDEAQDNYKTVLLTSKSSSIINLTDLREKTGELSMTFVNEGSTSGNLVPRLFLSANGISSPEESFKEVRYSGNHTSAWEDLLSGKTDVTAFGSNEYFTLIENNPEILNQTKLLWMSHEIPLGPVLVKNTTSAKDQALIKSMLLVLHQTDTDIIGSIKDGWSEAKQAQKFISIEDTYYDPFRNFQGGEADLQGILKQFAK